MSDKVHLRWLDTSLGEYQLQDITRDLVDTIANKKLETGVTPTTVNRMLEVLRAILRKAQMEWEWDEQE